MWGFLPIWYWVDPVASILIACIIAVGSLRIIRKSVNVLLEATPEGLDVSAVVRSMDSVPGVKDIHDLHIWAITPEIRALSCHVAVDDISVSHGASLLSLLNETLEQQFSIGHTTIQMECEGFDPNDLYCTLSLEGEQRSPAHTH